MINCTQNKDELGKNFNHNPFDNNFNIDTNILLKENFIKKEYGDNSFKLSKNYNNYILDYIFIKSKNIIEAKIISISIDSIRKENSETENIDSLVKKISLQPFDTLKLNQLMKTFNLSKVNQNNSGVITYRNSKDQSFDLIFEYCNDETSLRRNLIHISVKD